MRRPWIVVIAVAVLTYLVGVQMGKAMQRDLMCAAIAETQATVLKDLYCTRGRP